MRYVIAAVIASLAFIPSARANEEVPGRGPKDLSAEIAREAQSKPQDMAPSSAGTDYVPPASNLVQHKNDIAYATGGVGEEEREQLKSLESEFNLKVLSAMNSGAYVGNYTVRVSDTKNVPVLEVESDGPYFYAKLPPGTYTVETLSGGAKMQHAKVSVNDKGLKTIHFRWSVE